MTNLFSGKELLAIAAYFDNVSLKDQMMRELREALKFYADTDNYQPEGVATPDPSPIDSDNGKKARAALEKR